MRERQQRAREQFPQVLLAVMGIIQALALELLWERGATELDRWRAIDAFATGVAQVLAVFLGIVVLWVLFATLVLRFRWLPRFRDLVAPFVLGALEFILIECMAPELLARWFLVLALIFVVASITTFATFQSVFDQDDLAVERLPMNEQLASYIPPAVVVTALLVCAAIVRWSGPAGAASFVALLVANLGLAVQLAAVRFYWQRDLSVDRSAAGGRSSG